MRISIIIPIHNAESFISRTLRALIKNLQSSIEIVCVFDNCTDNSFDVVNEFLCTQDRALISYKLENVNFKSVALSRNYGILKSTCNLICFLDHDDFLDASIFEVVNNLNKQFIKFDIIRFGHEVHSKQKITINSQHPSKESYPFHGIFIWNAIYKKQLLIDNKIEFKKGYGEDYEFNIELLKIQNVTEIRITDRCYYVWNIHKDNQHKKRTVKDFFIRINSIIDNHYDFITKNEKIKYYFTSWYISYIKYLLQSNKKRDVLCHSKIISKKMRSLVAGTGVFLSENSKWQKIIISGFDKKDRYKVYNYSCSIKFNKLIIMKLLKNWYLMNIRNKYHFFFNKNDTIVYNRSNYLVNHRGLKSLFFIYSGHFISGGLISIYSIASKMRSLGYEPIMLGDKFDNNHPINKLFDNNEVTISFDNLITKDFHNIRYIMIPDVLIEKFSSLCKQYNLKFPQATINILNQNIDLMPEPLKIKDIYAIGKRITMTTAHQKYSTQYVSDNWNMPLKHISTYMSYKDYFISPFLSKKNLILYSHEENPLKEDIIRILGNSFPSYELRIIAGMRYNDYKNLAQDSKFSITFGEGLDNYFIESFFCGGIGIAVYNPEFMPECFLEFDNVFISYSDMVNSISKLIHKIISDYEYFYLIWQQNYKILQNMYDGDIYDKKIKEFIDDKFDFIPKL
ncbi:glycosyltransferase family 2 protein [Rickettsiales bacterium]|nr:glycosyltransferase family 2 protein [Rickettsiales bacterium]